MSEKPYLRQYLIIRESTILKITTMNLIFRVYKNYLLEIIENLGNKTKHATFPYPTFLTRPVRFCTFYLVHNPVDVLVRAE